ncbi:MAG TPA: response regulator [Nitrososphaera sp.]
MKKVLIVDDNKNVADLAEIILCSAGYGCTKTSDGKSGLDAIRESYRDNSGYDLVLLDVAMPGFSGMDVLDALKREGYLERTRVTFFTASSATSIEAADLEKMGALGCLRKPFTKAELLNFVGKHIAG